MATPAMTEVLEALKELLDALDQFKVETQEEYAGLGKGNWRSHDALVAKGRDLIRRERAESGQNCKLAH